jgi:hypothetical protein
MKATLIGQETRLPSLHELGYGEETYSFKGYSGDKDNTQISLDISRNGFGPRLIQDDQFNWEYEIEITITAKPKQQGFIIKL